MGENQNSVIPMVVFLIVALAGMYIISTQMISTQTKPQNVYISQQQTEHTVSVSGKAKTTVAPNLAQISFTVETNDAASAKRAQEENAETVKTITDALRASGVDQQDIETVRFSVTPITVSKWKCSRSTRSKSSEISKSSDIECDYYDRVYYNEILRYKATHQMRVKSDDTRKAGELLDAISRSAGNKVSVDAVSFTLKEETKMQLERSLLEKAARDARDKAQKIVAGTGASLGTIISASESVIYPVYDEYEYARAIAEAVNAAPPTQVSPGTIEVTANVKVQFEVT
jgi:hypothetical protein